MRVGGAEPRPQLTGRGDVSVIARRAHRRDLSERRGLGHVGRSAHAPLQRDAALTSGTIDSLLPRPGPARNLAQSAHAEEDLDQPVVLERLDAPRDALIQPPLVRLRRSPVPRTDRPRARAPRAAIGASDDRWRMWATSGSECSRSRSAATPSGSTSARGSQAIIADGGTTHSSVSNGRRSACGYHHESSCTDPIGTPRASRSSTAATTEPAGSRPGSVRYQYAAPLSVQYEGRLPNASGQRPGRTVPARRKSSAPHASMHERTSGPAMTAMSVVKPAGTVSRSPCQPHRTVPPFNPIV